MKKDFTFIIVLASLVLFTLTYNGITLKSLFSNTQMTTKQEQESKNLNINIEDLSEKVGHSISTLKDISERASDKQSDLLSKDDLSDTIITLEKLDQSIKTAEKTPNENTTGCETESDYLTDKQKTFVGAFLKFVIAILRIGYLRWFTSESNKNSEAYFALLMSIVPLVLFFF